MKAQMDLTKVTENIDEYNEDHVICVRKPWDAHSECCVVPFDESLAIPSAIVAKGFDYFLEVYIAKEVLGVLSGKKAQIEDKVRLLIFYATNDAYPEWIPK